MKTGTLASIKSNRILMKYNLGIIRITATQNHKFDSLMMWSIGKKTMEKIVSTCFFFSSKLSLTIDIDYIRSCGLESAMMQKYGPCWCESFSQSSKIACCFSASGIYSMVCSRLNWFCFNIPFGWFVCCIHPSNIDAHKYIKSIGIIVQVCRVCALALFFIRAHFLSFVHFK